MVVYRSKCEACGKPLEVPTWVYCDRPECIYKRGRKSRLKKNPKAKQIKWLKD